MEKLQKPDKELRKIIHFDNDREFVSLLKSHLPEDYVGTSVNLSSPELWKLICSHQAVKCAAVILKPGSGYLLNPNMPLGDGMFPLNLAAQSLCYSVTELLLQSGARPDLGSDDDLAKHPLILALDAISHNSVFSDWTEKKSIFKLFYILSISELLDPLQTVELLVSESKLVDTISVRCVKNGDIVQLVALLMVAWDKLMVPFADQGIEHSPTVQFILDELEVLLQQEKKYIGCGFYSPLAMLHERKVKLEAAWKAVKVLETAHGTFKQHRREGVSKWLEPHELPFRFADKLWNFYNMALTPEEIYVDDVKCLQPGLKPRKKAWLRRKIMEQVHGQSTLPTTLQRRTAGTGFSLRSYHTFQALDSKAMLELSSGSSRQELYVELMKKPIIRFTPKKRELNGFELIDPEEVDCDFRYAVGYATTIDNKERYIDVIKNLPSDEAVPKEAWDFLFEYDSVQCVAALLNGELSGKFDLISTLSSIGSTPLHEAARHSAIRLTAMLLGRGEVADTRIDYNKDGLILKDVLPLDLALASIRSHSFLKDWNKSAFQLVKLSKGMDLYLENVRLLVRSTKEADKLFTNFVKRGNMVEVGALLMVGYRPSSTFQLQGIVEEGKEGIVGLLEIFDRIGVELSAYIRVKRLPHYCDSYVVADIASLFQDAGLPVNSKDTPCSSSMRRIREMMLANDGVFSFRRQWSPDAVIPNYHGLSVGGFRSYHASSALNADKTLASSWLSNSICAMPKYRFQKQCNFFRMALRRGVRFI